MTTHLIGRRKSDRARVFVSIELSQQEGRETETVTHETVTGPYVRLSLQGFVIEKGRRLSSEGGQITFDPTNVEPAEGWTVADIESLIRTWGRWHLNDMKAACAHMELPEAKDYDSRQHITCPETGYRYGHKWLLDPLPAEVETEVRRLQSLPYGEVPDTY